MQSKELIEESGWQKRRSKLRRLFFSSRRRHTIWNCDWSSDVCSSDLKNSLGPCIVKLNVNPPISAASIAAEQELLEKWLRSEERRVGKERRARGSLKH